MFERNKEPSLHRRSCFEAKKKSPKLNLVKLLCRGIQEYIRSILPKKPKRQLSTTILSGY